METVPVFANAGAAPPSSSPSNRLRHYHPQPAPLPIIKTIFIAAGITSIITITLNPKPVIIIVIRDADSRPDVIDDVGRSAEELDFM